MGVNLHTSFWVIAIAVMGSCGVATVSPRGTPGSGEASPTDVGQGGAAATRRSDRADPASPPRVTPGSSILAFSLGEGNQHRCVLLRDGTVRCDGSNWAGQLGGGETTTAYQAGIAVAGLRDVIQIEINPTRGISCALQRAGNVYCWGSNEIGLVGVGHDDDEACRAERVRPCRRRPALVTDLHDVRKITMNSMSVCALVQSGSVYCWGELGGGLGVPPTSRPRIAPHIANAADIWGRGPRNFVRLRDGQVIEYPIARPVDHLSNADVAPSLLGALCARRADGTIRCSGTGAFGELGIPLQTSPDQVVNPGLDRVREVVSGLTHTCASREDGSVWCWGDARFGALGSTDGRVEMCAQPLAGMAPCVRSPARVLGVDGVERLFLGLSATCVTKRDRSAWCWGMHPDGTHSPTPVRVD